MIQLDDLFAVRIRVQNMDGSWTEAHSLDDIGSTGTRMTAKAMIFIQLVRAVVGDERYRLHFYLDETGQLDDYNLHAITQMASERGIVPITAEHHRDRLLESEVRDVGDDLPELVLTARARVHDHDLVDRNPHHVRVPGTDHATASTLATRAIPRKNSSDSNRNVSIAAPLNSVSLSSGMSRSIAGNR